jgi:protein tyrosine phosphatase
MSVFRSILCFHLVKAVVYVYNDNRFQKEAASPFAVVCSDGAARSGTFTAIEIISQLLWKGHITTVSLLIQMLKNVPYRSIGSKG